MGERVAATVALVAAAAALTSEGLVNISPTAPTTIVPAMKPAISSVRRGASPGGAAAAGRAIRSIDAPQRRHRNRPLRILAPHDGQWSGPSVNELLAMTESGPPPGQRHC